MKLLTGAKPIRFESASPTAIREVMERAVIPPLSDQLSHDVMSQEDLAQLCEERSSTAPQLRRQLKGDLEAIIRRCLSKIPSERYGTAGQLASELRRYLNHQPVLARTQNSVLLDGQIRPTKHRCVRRSGCGRGCHSRRGRRCLCGRQIAQLRKLRQHLPSETEPLKKRRRPAL